MNNIKFIALISILMLTVLCSADNVINLNESKIELSKRSAVNVSKRETKLQLKKKTIKRKIFLKKTNRKLY